MLRKSFFFISYYFRIRPTVKRNSFIINYLLTAVLSMVLWFIMSGKTEMKFLILGCLSSLLVAGVCVRTLTMKGAKSGNDYFLLKINPFKFVIYLVWLIVQIIKSAIYVSRVTLFRNSEVQPSIAWFKADYDNPSARAVLANSITLTPGTITIDITQEGIYSVHALTKEVRDGVLDGSMQAKVAWLFGENIDFHPLDEDSIPKETVTTKEQEVIARIKGRRKNS